MWSLWQMLQLFSQIITIIFSALITSPSYRLSLNYNKKNANFGSFPSHHILIEIRTSPRVSVYHAAVANVIKYIIAIKPFAPSRTILKTLYYLLNGKLNAIQQRQNVKHNVASVENDAPGCRSCTG